MILVKCSYVDVGNYYSFRCGAERSKFLVPRKKRTPGSSNVMLIIKDSWGSMKEEMRSLSTLASWFPLRSWPRLIAVSLLDCPNSVIHHCARINVIPARNKCLASNLSISFPIVRSNYLSVQHRYHEASVLTWAVVQAIEKTAQKFLELGTTLVKESSYIKPVFKPKRGAIRELPPANEVYLLLVEKHEHPIHVQHFWATLILLWLMKVAIPDWLISYSRWGTVHFWKTNGGTWRCF